MVQTLDLCSCLMGTCSVVHIPSFGFQVCLAFNPQSTIVATGSMDTTAKLWDVQKGAEISTLSVSTSLFHPTIPQMLTLFLW